MPVVAHAEMNRMGSAMATSEPQRESEALSRTESGELSGPLVTKWGKKNALTR